jgi:hypothetical protein
VVVVCGAQGTCDVAKIGMEASIFKDLGVLATGMGILAILESYYVVSQRTPCPIIIP